MSTRSAAAFALVGTAAAALLYLVYFDYRRQSDPEFRRALRRTRRKAAKAEQERILRENPIRMITAEQALALAHSSFPSPRTLEAAQDMLLANLQKAEMLLISGPSKYVEATIALYQAVVTTPNVTEILPVLEQTTPPEVMGLLIKMLQMPASAARQANAKKIIREPTVQEIF